MMNSLKNILTADHVILGIECRPKLYAYSFIYIRTYRYDI